MFSFVYLYNVIHIKMYNLYEKSIWSFIPDPFLTQVLVVKEDRTEMYEFARLYIFTRLFDKSKYCSCELSGDCGSFHEIHSLRILPCLATCSYFIKSIILENVSGDSSRKTSGYDATRLWVIIGLYYGWYYGIICFYSLLLLFLCVCFFIFFYCCLFLAGSSGQLRDGSTPLIDVGLKPSLLLSEVELLWFRAGRTSPVFSPAVRPLLYLI